MSSKALLLALINTANTTSYTDVQVAIGNPVVIDGAQAGEANTTVTVSGKPEAGFSGSKDLTYKRLDLAQQFLGKTLAAAGPATNATSEDILDDLEAQYALGIEAADIVVEVVDFSSGTYTLKANPNSFKWIGQVAVNVSLDTVDIGPSLATTDLPGFEYATLA